ncbi:hypothetical protein CRYUN_Cryun24cG0032600 [Craigia yunnanensis]
MALVPFWVVGVYNMSRVGIMNSFGLLLTNKPRVKGDHAQIQPKPEDADGEDGNEDDGDGDFGEGEEELSSEGGEYGNNSNGNKNNPKKGAGGGAEQNGEEDDDEEEEDDEDTEMRKMMETRMRKILME